MVGRHFAKFKTAHRDSMALANVDRTRFTSSNGGNSAKAMQDVLHLPESLPVRFRLRDGLKAWWHRFAKEWEPITVNKSIDSITMPKWIAIGILGAVLTFGVQSWWKASDQRDLLIELKTEMRMNKEFEAERARQIKEQADLNKVYIDNTTAQLNIIRGMLSQQQINAVEKKGN